MDAYNDYVTLEIGDTLILRLDPTTANIVDLIEGQGQFLRDTATVTILDNDCKQPLQSIENCFVKSVIEFKVKLPIILPMSETYSTSLFHHMCFDQHLYIHVHLHSWLGLMTSEPENLFPCNKFISSCIIMCIDFVAMTCNILYCRTDMYQK